jgi:GNAT superfamily N-acetyltransferase
LFGKYHYLSHTFNRPAQCFAAFIDKTPVAFTSILHFVHPRVPNAKREHRTVVLPDYQGVGIGTAIRNAVAEHVTRQGLRYITVLSHPALIASMKRDPKWRCTNVGRQIGRHMGIVGMNDTLSSHRITTSWEFIRQDVKGTP